MRTRQELSGVANLISDLDGLRSLWSLPLRRNCRMQVPLSFSTVLGSRKSYKSLRYKLLFPFLAGCIML